jgi:hypothetical protein
MKQDLFLDFDEKNQALKNYIAKNKIHPKKKHRIFIDGVKKTVLRVRITMNDHSFLNKSAMKNNMSQAEYLRQLIRKGVLLNE